MRDTGLFAAAGGRADIAAEAATAMCRALWNIALTAEEPIAADKAGTRAFQSSKLHVYLAAELAPKGRAVPLEARMAEEIRDALLRAFDSPLDSVSALVPLDAFNPFRLAQNLLSGCTRPADTDYFVGRELRRRHRISFSMAHMRSLRTYTARLKAWVECRDITCHHMTVILRIAFEDAEAEAPLSEDISAEAFFDLIAAVGWVLPASEPGEVTIRANKIQIEALTNRYFGFPTAIPGLDAIFGGCGPLLVDAPFLPVTACSTAQRSAQPIGGRVILVSGAYGTGKSTLTFEMAVEVARKGGVAMIATLEQTPEECLFAMESLGISTSCGDFETVHEMREAIAPLIRPYSGKGMLAFLPIRPRKSRSFEDFLSAVGERLDWLDSFPLRLLIVDPINSVAGDDPNQSVERRRSLLDLFQRAKDLGINLWMTCERNGPPQEDTPFEENIADTVLHLEADRKAQFARRWIQIRKSRLQREEPGQHSVTMESPTGMRVHPSSASLIRKFSRDTEPLSEPVPTFFGIEGVDRILGKGAIVAGDMIALHGPPGSSRTLVGMQFLFSTDSPHGGATSLFVSDAAEAKMRSVAHFARPRQGHIARSESDIQYLTISTGLVEPSQILEAIDERFCEAERAGRPIDRVMIADLSRWETETPLMEGDPSFGDALFGLLRHWRATSVLLADFVPPGRSSVLPDLIVNAADAVLEFNPVSHGKTHQLVLVTRSRGMTHRKDAVELIIDSFGVRVDSRGTLLRKDAAGHVRAVKVRLFLHADSPHHQDFNDRVIGAMQTSLTEAVVVEQAGRYDPEMFRFTSVSAVDEVQVMQLDEFQLPEPGTPDLRTRFAVFPSARLENLSDDLHKGQRNNYIPRLGQRTATPDGALFAVPFYENISLMCYHSGRLKEILSPEEAAALDGKTVEEAIGRTGSEAWKWLRDRALEWERRSPEHIFFSCPLAQAGTVETYNCLFFEILQSYVPLAEDQSGDILSWLSADGVEEAAFVFRDLCYRSRRHETKFFRTTESGRDNRRTRGRDNRRIRTFNEYDSREQGPVFWRHWYNTLSQMFWDLRDEERSQIRVEALFDKRTTAGEWYLAVPAYSAAPELAWDIIQMLTDPAREMERIYRGVGLPTRKPYYDQHIPSKAIARSPFFHIAQSSLKELVGSAFRRSRFRCYTLFAETISAHLQRMLEEEDHGNPEKTRDHIRQIVHHMQESIRYMQSTSSCGESPLAS